MKECDWMAKKRIYEIAKEVGVDNKVVVQKAKDLGLDVKNHMSSVDDSQVAKLKNSFQNSFWILSKTIQNISIGILLLLLC